jgi:hypothetical protein
VRFRQTANWAFISGKRARYEFGVEETHWVDRTRHRDLAARGHLETRAGVIGKITYENHKLIAEAPGTAHALKHEFQSPALIFVSIRNHERPEKKGLP